MADQTRTRNRPRAIAADVHAWIGALALRSDRSAAAIHRELGARFPPDRVPALRTVQNIVNELRPGRGGDPWDPRAASPEEARLLLPVIPALITESQGARRWLNEDEAQECLWIRRAVPRLDPADAVLLARLYLGRERRKQPTRDLDAFLAFAPWSGEAANARYNEAHLAGWIPLIPIYLVFASRGLRRYAEQHGGLPIALPEGGLRGRGTLADLAQAYTTLVLGADPDDGPGDARERERDAPAPERVEGA